MRVDRRTLLVVSAALVFVPWRRAVAADTVARLTAELRHDRSFKVRIQAAYLLAKMDDPRVLPALVRALAQDEEKVVREFAAKLVGRNPGGDVRGQKARQALADALRDPSETVRRSAKGALQELDRILRATAQQRVALANQISAGGTQGQPDERIQISVRQIADQSGHASNLVRQRARAELLNELRTLPRVTVVQVGQSATFVLDGTIRKLTTASLRADVEVTCAIELILSRQDRGILMVASGEASVQKGRGQFRTGQRGILEEEAAMHAVRSAHENLAAFLARQ